MPKIRPALPFSLRKIVFNFERSAHWARESVILNAALCSTKRIISADMVEVILPADLHAMNFATLKTLSQCMRLPHFDESLLYLNATRVDMSRLDDEEREAFANYKDSILAVWNARHQISSMNAILETAQRGLNAPARAA